jgi:hypothetical protein
MVQTAMHQAHRQTPLARRIPLIALRSSPVIHIVLAVAGGAKTVPPPAGSFRNRTGL